MKRFLLTILLLIISFLAFAQNGSPDTLSIQAVFDACVQLRNAVESGDSTAIKLAAKRLRACNVNSFRGLTSTDIDVSLNGHLVFDPDFADSLAEGRDVYQQADIYAASEKGENSELWSSAFSKTLVVKAHQSTFCDFEAYGRQELCVVAEFPGKVTMKIHANNDAGFDKTFNDKDDVKLGRMERRSVFQLPDQPHCKVHLEIINCGDKDTSVVVISN